MVIALPKTNSSFSKKFKKFGKPDLDWKTSTI
jgi:hypothetical protein